MRLIDADELKETIFEKTDSLEDLWDTAGILNAINNAPTVPQPDFKEGYKQAIIDGKTNYSRPQGKWIFDDEIYQCPFCFMTQILPYNYCPTCGAKLDSEEG